MVRDHEFMLGLKVWFALVEKSLKMFVPKDDPFTIRLTSEVLESSGKKSLGYVM
jgi:polyribonucleotide nucleotidyltransferase